VVTLADVPVPRAFATWRRFAMDDALLLFDRDTGWNALCDGAETVGLRQQAPRVVQFAITNVCNLACTFCSRDVDDASEWTVGSAFTFLRELAAAGVLEVAFGGGEPFAFRGYAELVQRLREQTPLAVHATTNGRLLDDARLAAVRGCHGQLRLSVYDDVDWRAQVRRLAASGERFGVNLLLTPLRAERLEALVCELAELGCRDVLLLRYKGPDRALAITSAVEAELGARVARLAAALHGRAEVKLDVCFGDWLAAAPRLFARADCGAGRDFVVVTSDRRVSPCSFHQDRVPVADAADLLRLWREQRDRLAAPARVAGCARLPAHGLAGGEGIA
jgi:MoaA/NifB/PqqE/SkfB family radical SAM enzyme